MNHFTDIQGKLNIKEAKMLGRCLLILCSLVQQASWDALLNSGRMAMFKA